jgi:hypothetical protein
VKTRRALGLASVWGRGADPDDHAWWIEMNLDEEVEAVNYGDPVLDR